MERNRHKQSSQLNREETFESLPDSIEFTPSKPNFIGSSTPMHLN